MRTLLFVLLSSTLYAQTWTFQQGYILEDSTVTIVNQPLTAVIHPNLITLNTLELMYDSYEVIGDNLKFSLSDGGLLYYTEQGDFGPGIVIYYANIRVVAWTIPQATFKINLK